MVHYSIKITGKVQGVFFRASTLRTAQELKLTGTVKNELDGSVAIEVEGNKLQIEPFVKWCHQGPILAKIKSVKISQAPLFNYKEFSII